jgi:hypothetical protein
VVFAATLSAFIALLAFAISLTVGTFKGILEHTMRALENCAPPCAVGPLPPEPLEKQVAKWLLVAAVAAILIKSILDQKHEVMAVEELLALAVRAPARPTQQLFDPEAVEVEVEPSAPWPPPPSARAARLHLARCP